MGTDPRFGPAWRHRFPCRNPDTVIEAWAVVRELYPAGVLFGLLLGGLAGGATLLRPTLPGVAFLLLAAKLVVLYLLACGLPRYSIDVARGATPVSRLSVLVGHLTPTSRLPALDRLNAYMAILERGGWTPHEAREGAIEFLRDQDLRVRTRVGPFAWILPGAVLAMIGWIGEPWSPLAAAVGFFMVGVGLTLVAGGGWFDMTKAVDAWRTARGAPKTRKAKASK